VIADVGIEERFTHHHLWHPAQGHGDRPTSRLPNTERKKKEGSINEYKKHKKALIGHPPSSQSYCNLPCPPSLPPSLPISTHSPAPAAPPCPCLRVHKSPRAQPAGTHPPSLPPSLPPHLYTLTGTGSASMPLSARSYAPTGSACRNPPKVLMLEEATSSMSFMVVLSLRRRERGREGGREEGFINNLLPIHTTTPFPQADFESRTRPLSLRPPPPWPPRQAPHPPPG